MMAPTHRPLGSAWWLAGALAVDAVAAPFGASPVNPLVAVLGAAIAPVFAAGRWSPDADTTWLSRLGHRQATHRPDTTAVALTAATAVLWVPAAIVLPFGLAALAWAPVAGWWSHLAGDFLFGRIPFGPAAGAAMARVVPSGWVRHTPGGRQAYWIGVGWDTDGLLERGKVTTDGRRTGPLRAMWRAKRARANPGRDARGLRTTQQVLPFAPTTSALRGMVAALTVAHAALWLVTS
jgi:hypothetical protein